MTTRQAQAAVIAYEVVMEEMADARAEKEWLARAAAGGQVMPLRVMHAEGVKSSLEEDYG